MHLKLFHQDKMQLGKLELCSCASLEINSNEHGCFTPSAVPFTPTTQRLLYIMKYSSQLVSLEEGLRRAATVAGQ